MFVCSCICICVHICRHTHIYICECIYIRRHTRAHVDLAKLTWTEWTEPNDPKPDPNLHLKDLNRFRSETKIELTQNQTYPKSCWPDLIRNLKWPNPKSNRPEILLIRCKPKPKMTGTEPKPNRSNPNTSDPNPNRPEPNLPDSILTLSNASLSTIFYFNAIMYWYVLKSS